MSLPSNQYYTSFLKTTLWLLDSQRPLIGWYRTPIKSDYSFRPMKYRLSHAMWHNCSALAPTENVMNLSLLDNTQFRLHVLIRRWILYCLVFFYQYDKSVPSKYDINIAFGSENIVHVHHRTSRVTESSYWPLKQQFSNWYTSWPG